MARLISLFAFILIPFFVVAQTPTSPVLQGRIDEWESDTIRLFVLNGMSLQPVAKAPVFRDEVGRYFSMTFADITPGFYFLGAGTPQHTKQLILGIDSLVQVQGSYQAFYQAGISGSPANDAYVRAIQTGNQLQQSSNGLNRQYMMAKSKGEETAQFSSQMEQLDQDKLSLLQSVSEIHPLLGKAIALRTYLNAPSRQSQYPSEIDFFASTFFSQATLTDPAYERMPQLFESFQAYASTLGSAGMGAEKVIEYCEEQLNDIPQPGLIHKGAILGLTSGFKDRNNDAFAYFGNLYLDQYPEDQTDFTKSLKQEISARQALLLGAVAPNLKLPTPEGDSLAIRDLRGKIVLLDFWASWCRPCRVENPRVKAMYERHKDQGFEILGLSLDRSKDAWVKAIADDGLPWHHVSDLRAWQSVASETYNVSAIPYTVLLDQEGRIIAKGLRGEALEAKVAELLAE